MVSFLKLSQAVFFPVRRLRVMVVRISGDLPEAGAFGLRF